MELVQTSLLGGVPNRKNGESPSKSQGETIKTDFSTFLGANIFRRFSVEARKPHLFIAVLHCIAEENLPSGSGNCNKYRIPAFCLGESAVKQFPIGKASQSSKNEIEGYSD